MSMNISILDGSNYFRGLLILIRRDRTVTDTEVALLQRIGKTLGFEKEFTDNAIQDILENTYIDETPPRFTSETLAEKFVRDGLLIACSDRVLHPSEEQWLRTAAAANGLTAQWFADALAYAVLHQHEQLPMEVEDIVVNYTK